MKIVVHKVHRMYLKLMANITAQIKILNEVDIADIQNSHDRCSNNRMDEITYGPMDNAFKAHVYGYNYSNVAR